MSEEIEVWYCECGHGIDSHGRGGCNAIIRYVAASNIIGYVPIGCDCHLTKEAIEARYWARHMMKEKCEAENMEGLLELDCILLEKERDALQAKLEVAIEALNTIPQYHLTEAAKEALKKLEE